jgi:hypothetical protein
VLYVCIQTQKVSIINSIKHRAHTWSHWRCGRLLVVEGRLQPSLGAQIKLEQLLPLHTVLPVLALLATTRFRAEASSLMYIAQ